MVEQMIKFMVERYQPMLAFLLCQLVGNQGVYS